MNIDIIITQAINNLSNRNIFFDKLFIYYTEFGLCIMVFSIILFWWLRSDRDNARHKAIKCWTATVMALMTNQVIILFIDRVRPYNDNITNLIIKNNPDPSFPSDHTTVAFAIAFILILKKDKYSKIYLSLAILMGFTRIYVGTHYITDVIAWAFIAFIVSIIVIKFYDKFRFITNKLVKIL